MATCEYAWNTRIQECHPRVTDSQSQSTRGADANRARSAEEVHEQGRRVEGIRRSRGPRCRHGPSQEGLCVVANPHEPLLRSFVSDGFWDARASREAPRDREGASIRRRELPLGGEAYMSALVDKVAAFVGKFQWDSAEAEDEGRAIAKETIVSVINEIAGKATPPILQEDAKSPL